MDNLIQYIYGSAGTELTLEGVLRLFVFMMVLECISNIVRSMMKVGVR